MYRKVLAVAITVAVLILVAWRSSSVGQDASAPGALPEQTYLIESLNGRVLFGAYCASCHGLDAKGGGPAASALKVPPADLTLISRRNGGVFPSVRVQKMISGEEGATAAHGSREMPIWGPIFGQIAWDQDLGAIRIYNLSKYLESLQRK